jgi:hypothetical protein
MAPAAWNTPPISDTTPAKGLLRFADSPEEGAAKLIAVKKAEDAASAVDFSAMFAPPAPSGEEIVGGLAPTS